MKIALITGSAIRIGRGIAETMLEANYRLILHAHTSIETLNEWVKKNTRKDQVIATICADLSSEKGQIEFCQKVQECTDRLHTIVHNASVFKPEVFESISRESYRLNQGINLDAPFFITQSLLPLLRKSENPSVINIIDALWSRPRPLFSHYSVGKAGLAILTKVLAQELAPKIRVNAIAPGTFLFQPFHSQQTRAQVINKIPLGKIGTVNEIGKTVLFISESLYMTGEIISIDGGRSLV
ncbi:MAG: SDR family oxidoreductase [Myxococcales bacterium]|nr:SDR family oxidoreductase [Myxococcales bacterium]USN51818.1 MAG: SDR family oxidoreductase [Myxococcales bacterium]